MGTTGSLLRQAAIRFSLLALLGAVVLCACGRQVEDATLPVLREMLSVVDRDHHIERLELLDKPSGRKVQLTVTRAHFLFVGGRLIEPHPTATAQGSTLIGALDLTLVLVLASAGAWPAQRNHERLLRVMATLPAVIAAVVVDIPLLLSAELWRLYLAAFNPSGWSPLVVWSDFMAAGGRYLVPISLGVAASAPSWMHARRRNAAVSQALETDTAEIASDPRLVHPPV